MAVVRPESRLGYVIRVHPHLMIATPQVQLGEEAGAPKLVQQLIDDGDGKDIAHRLGIQRSVVDAGPPVVSPAANEYGGRSGAEAEDRWVQQIRR